MAQGGDARISVSELIAQVWAARREDDASTAQRLAGEALDQARAGTECRDVVRALKAVGQVQWDQDRPADALVYFLEAEAACRSCDTGLLLSHTLRHVADLYLETQQPELADRYATEAVTIMRSHPEVDALEQANTLRRAALAAEALNRRDEARALWSETSELYDRAGVPPGVDEAQEHLAGLA